MRARTSLTVSLSSSAVTSRATTTANATGARERMLLRADDTAASLDGKRAPGGLGPGRLRPKRTGLRATKTLTPRIVAGISVGGQDNSPDGEEVRRAGGGSL